MSEFKGIKWRLGGISGRMVQTNEYSGYVADVDTIRNAKLIVKSPEMLNMLNDMVSDWENTSKFPDDILMEYLGKAKILIQEATDLK